MKSVRPKPLPGAAVAKLPLSPEEGFVLSRINGQLSVKDLVALTGLEAARVEQIVTKLATHGAVAIEAADASSGYLPDPGSDPSLRGAQSTASLAEFASALGMDPSDFAAAEGVQAAREAPVRADRVESKSSYPPHMGPGGAMTEIPELTDEHVVGDAHAHAHGHPSPDEAVPASQQTIEAEAAAEAGDLEETQPTEGEAGDEENPDVAANERNFRQLYEAKFHPLSTDARVQAADTAHGSDLFALCFDADPRVVAAILHNHSVGLDHVRLLAFHHRTGTGLEMVSRRMEFLRDVLVERRLLRNPMCGEMVLSRIMASKRLAQTYKICLDREIPEITRAKSRGHLRLKWQTAPPEDRADLVIRTEGRCLVYMTGCTFDAKTTQIMCGRQYNSVLFIQNLARFTATPPNLLAHLLKQPFVRKSVPLKRMLLQHPNMPGDAKRQI